MAGGYYFVGADAKLWIQDSPIGTATLEPVTDTDLIGVVRGWNFSLKFDYKPLFAMDSVFYLAIARCKCKVEGSFKYVKFDALSGWFANAIDCTDTSKIKTFVITGECKPAAGSDSGAIDIDAKIEGARFSNVTFNVEEHDWVALDMPFVGSYLTLGGVTVE
jgi:uncharacterized protein YneR